MTHKKFPQRKKIRLRDFNYASSGHIFFITICTVNKQPYFSNANISEIVVKELGYRREKREIKLFCYCVMPDHLHILLELQRDFTEKRGAFGERTLQNWVSAFKRHTARMVWSGLGIKPLWQQNFYDYIVRSSESLIEICEYILNNAVRKGMVSTWVEHPYSKMIDSLPL